MSEDVITHFQTILSKMENREVSRLEVAEFLCGYENFEDSKPVEIFDSGLH